MNNYKSKVELLITLIKKDLKKDGWIIKENKTLKKLMKFRDGLETKEIIEIKKVWETEWELLFKWLK